MSPSALETSATPGAAVWRGFGGIMLSVSLVLVWLVLFTADVNLDTLCYGMLCYGPVSGSFPFAFFLYVFCYSVLCFASLCFACYFASSDCICWAFDCLGFALLLLRFALLFVLHLFVCFVCFFYFDLHIALLRFDSLFVASLCCVVLSLALIRFAVGSHCPPRRPNGPTAQRAEVPRPERPTGQRANGPTGRRSLPSL